MSNEDVAPGARNVRVSARMGPGRVAIKLLGIWSPFSASGGRSKGSHLLSSSKPRLRPDVSTDAYELVFTTPVLSGSLGAVQNTWVALA